MDIFERIGVIFNPEHNPYFVSSYSPHREVVDVEFEEIKDEEEEKPSSTNKDDQ